ASACWTDRLAGGGVGVGVGVWAPGPLTVPVTHTPDPNTTVTFEFCSALPFVVPVHRTLVAFASTGPQVKPSRPLVVERTATGAVLTATPAGIWAERPQFMLPVTEPLPVTCPDAVQDWPTTVAQGAPVWPLG